MANNNCSWRLASSKSDFRDTLTLFIICTINPKNRVVFSLEDKVRYYDTSLIGIHRMITSLPASHDGSFHHCVHDCCNWNRRHNKDSRNPILSFVHFLGSKFLLEVMGAAGAVWGAADILLLRGTSEGNERMRILSSLVGGIFLIRYWWAIKHWWSHQHDYLPIKVHHRRTHRLAFFQIHSSKFVLHVLGGSGAIWGCAEAVTLRNAENVLNWRIASILVGSMFLFRWIFQMLAYCLYMSTLWSNPSSIHMTIIRCVEAFIVKLILEVFGAVGAVWGFSEILTLRTSESNDVWRPVSIVVGIIFLMRWILYSVEFIQSGGTSPADHEKDATSSSNDVTDIERNDLEFEVTDSHHFSEIKTPIESMSIEGENSSDECEDPPQPPQSLTPSTTKTSTPQKRYTKQITL